jgi:hypothetical protein
MVDVSVTVSGSPNMNNVVIISKKKRGRDKIKSTGNDREGSQDGQWRNCCQSMAESRGTVVIPM